MQGKGAENSLYRLLDWVYSIWKGKGVLILKMQFYSKGGKPQPAFVRQLPVYITYIIDLAMNTKAHMNVS